MKGTWTNSLGESGEFEIADPIPGTVSIPSVWLDSQITRCVCERVFTCACGQNNHCRKCGQGVGVSPCMCTPKQLINWNIGVKSADAS